MSRNHWRQTVEMVGGDDTKLLGEDENGDLCVPSRTVPGWWDRKFNPWNPTHWRYWLRSRRLNRIAYLTYDPEAIS